MPLLRKVCRAWQGAHQRFWRMREIGVGDVVAVDDPFDGEVFGLAGDGGEGGGEEFDFVGRTSAGALHGDGAAGEASGRGQGVLRRHGGRTARASVASVSETIVGKLRWR